MHRHCVLVLGLPLALAAQDVGSARTDAAEPDLRHCRPAFDAKTLAGWITHGGRYDGNARWTVEDGALVGREGDGHAGGLIYTEARYASFLLTLETKIDWPFDSGVFLHMLPPASGLKGLQLTLDFRPDGEIGGVYADGWLQHNPLGMPRFQKDAWNRVVVRCTGRRPRLEAWLNGDALTDFRLPEGSQSFAHEGRIGLQVHGNRDDPKQHAARFRAIALLELPLFEPDEFECDARGQLVARPGSGWQPLFDGKTLDGWEPVGDAKGYAVEDGVLVLPKAGGDGYLRTRQDFTDFALRLDFKTAALANSGVFLRGARQGGEPSRSGCEIQILDDFQWEAATKTKLKPWQKSGSLYGAVPPAVPDALRPTGRWNTYEIVYRGPRLRVALNGHELYDVDTTTLAVEPPFAQRAKQGFLGLQRHAPAGEVTGDALVWFRNVFVKRL